MKARAARLHARRDLLEKLEALAAQVVFERALHKEIVALTDEPEGKCAAIGDRDVAIGVEKSGTVYERRDRFLAM